MVWGKKEIYSLYVIFKTCQAYYKKPLTLNPNRSRIPFDVNGDSRKI